MMEAELKEKWVAALRSGDYKQARRALFGPIKDVDCVPTGEYGYCCLGVLCDISGAGTWNIDMHFALNDPDDSDDSDPTANYLTEGMLVLFGLTDRQQRELANLNDVVLCSFDKIADYIEEGNL